MIECKFCQKPTTNAKFCSNSCAATYNNFVHPKRKPIKRVCKHCEVELVGRRTVCDDCNPNHVDWSKVTLGDVQRQAGNKQINARVRSAARTIYKNSKKPKCCVLCGYHRHYEVCHIKAISAFSADTPISEINSLMNLIALCPNHHWELDNGVLSL